MNSRVIPLMLVVLAVTLFVTVTYPAYTDPENGVKALQAKYAENAQTLDLAAELGEKREDLRKRYSRIKDDERNLLAKMLPSTVDNVRLVNEIYATALRRNVTIANVAVGAEAAGESDRNGRNAASDIASRSRSYGVLPVSFAARASYGDFEAFLRDLELSLRLVDVKSISLKAGTAGEYDWSLKLDTYWLR